MANLKITLTDAAGADLNDHVTIDLFSQQSSNHYQLNQFLRREIVIKQIDLAGGPVYRVMVTPANHQIIQFFTMLNESSTVEYTAPVPVDPGKVVTINGPSFGALASQAQGMMTDAQVPRFNDGVGGFLKGPGLYTALDKYPLLKACFLNIVAKSAATFLQDKTCLDYYRGLLRIEQDRLFIRVSAALVEETANSRSFHPVSDTAHEPLPGYQKVSSYKTFDQYGNLQLTFQRKGSTGDDYLADVDIDDAQGVEHLFQVLRNSVAGPTNPYNIREILLQQEIRVDPHYEFVFAAAAAA